MTLEREMRFAWKPIAAGALARQLEALPGCEPRADALGNMQAGVIVEEVPGEAIVIRTRPEADLSDIHDLVVAHSVQVHDRPAHVLLSTPRPRVVPGTD